MTPSAGGVCKQLLANIPAYAGIAVLLAMFQAYEKCLPVSLKFGRWLGHRKWISHGKERILRRIWHPDSENSCPFEVDFYGLKYRGGLNDFIDWCVFFYGEYSENELRLLEKLVGLLRRTSRRVMYLDVGTNVGHHLLFMTRLVDECYGIEPFGAVLSSAQDKLDINEVTNARLFQVAFGDRDEVRTFYPPARGNRGIGSLVEQWSPDLAAAGFAVSVRRGDSFLEEPGVCGLGIIKIDVEGFEASVCRGLVETFNRDRPFILLEITPTGLTELGGERGLRGCVCTGAQFYELLPSGNLTPYRWQEDFTEVVILPP